MRRIGGNPPHPGPLPKGRGRMNAGLLSSKGAQKHVGRFFGIGKGG